MDLPRGDSKERALRELVKVLGREKVAYAIIGGLAVQIYSKEPRTTLDIDVALRSYDDIPRAALKAAGFTFEATHAHSQNWRAPGHGARKQRTAIQFSADGLMGEAVTRAIDVRTREMRLKLAALPDLVLLKLEAIEEPKRRPSKRQHDIADVYRLLEDHPELERGMPDARERIGKVVAALVTKRPAR